MKSRLPQAASSFRTCSLTVDCRRFKPAPAIVKLRVRATAAKLFSQDGSNMEWIFQYAITVTGAIALYNGGHIADRTCMKRKILNLLDPYIGLMLIMVALAAVLPVHGRGAAIAATTADVAIVFLFFLYGTRLSPKAAIAGLIQWKLHIAVLLCTFALFPALGIGLTHLASGVLPQPLLVGVVLLCLMPSTVQSSIAFTSIAQGNVAAALCAASLSNLLGVFISPLLVGWLLQTSGVVLSFDVFRDIILQLLAPFMVGQLARPWIGEWMQRNKKILGYADRGSILLIIYVAFSKGMVENIWGEVGILDLFVLLAILTLLLAVVLLLTGFIGRRLMALSIEDEIVLQFCGSKKSLASGLPIASLLFPGPHLSLILLPLMLFHQIQLIVCAVLARSYAARADRHDPPRRPPDVRTSRVAGPATSRAGAG
jgi:solute carrier family 10 (sodium/bile acid cotransporter), member 7